MKIRSASELTDKLDAELAWRKRELTNIRLMVDDSRPHLKGLLFRSAVLLLYAHWEGYVKSGASYYLELVSRQKLKYRELRTSFVGLACKGRIIESLATDKSHLVTQLVDFLVLNGDDEARIPFVGIIETRSNLNYEVLREILHLIGLRCPARVEMGSLLLDERLLANRNRIAHGDYCDISAEDYEELHEFVLRALDDFRDELTYSAMTKLYRRV